MMTKIKIKPKRAISNDMIYLNHSIKTVKMYKFRKRLFAGGPPANKKLLTGGPPANKKLFSGGPPANNFLYL